MSADDGLAFATVRELGALLRSGELSPVELTESCLRRLDTLGRSLNAVVTLTEDIALEEARRAEAELHRGLDRGPLHGIPYGAKDILATAGVPTTWGVVPFRDQVFAHDATVVRRLREAGAVLAAKVATVELAGGMGYDHPDAALTGAPANPWDVSRWTGGSSSGPSAVVAAGLVPFAIGSDTGGSIVMPAAWTGTAGLRPTYGRVSRFGAMALCWTLDRLGPMTRSADDAGLVLEAIAGSDPRDPTSLPLHYAYADRPARTGGFRFGVIAGGAHAAEPEVVANFEASLEVLGELGSLEEVSLPDFPYAEVAETVMSAEAYAAFDDFLAAGRAVELTASKAHGHRLAASVLPAHDYIRAQRIRGHIVAAFDALAGRYDALLAPTLGGVAGGVDDPFTYNLTGDFPRELNLAGVLAGSPTISVHNGFGADHLPTGIAFAGARLAENAVLDAAAALEARTEWSRQHPQLAAVTTDSAK
jgi:aspartyl-tRNA(Asn)/glutamyl-tRNA(Gln) amidotransferase subunit A